MLNSLHLATEGLLQRGTKPTLGITVLGMLRSFGDTPIITDPHSRRGGAAGSFEYKPYEINKPDVSHETLFAADNEYFLLFQ